MNHVLCIFDFRHMFTNIRHSEVFLIHTTLTHILCVRTRMVICIYDTLHMMCIRKSKPVIHSAWVYVWKKSSKIFQKVSLISRNCFIASLCTRTCISFVWVRPICTWLKRIGYKHWIQSKWMKCNKWPFFDLNIII